MRFPPHPLLGLVLVGMAFAFSSEPAIASQRPEPLTLQLAIAKAMEKNPQILAHQLTVKSAEVTYDDAWDTMFMPQVTFALSSSSSKTVGNLHGNRASLKGEEFHDHGYPYSTASLTLGSYTLFNFGKDKHVFDQARLDRERSVESLEELKRDVKFNVIVAFWTYKTALDKLQAAKRSLELSEAIAALQESRLPLGKATESDVSSARIDVLSAMSRRDAAATTAKSAQWILNNMIGDSIGAEYDIQEKISHLPIKVTEDVLIQTYLKNAPSIKAAKVALTKAQMNLELELKNKLPLPKITFSGLTFSYTNHYYGGRTDFYTTTTGKNNLDVAAAVNLSLPILGTGGFLGSRAAEQARIAVSQAELSLRNTADSESLQILQFVQNVRQQEEAVKNSKEAFDKSTELLKSLFTRFNTDETLSRLEIRDSIQQARDSEFLLREAILSHLSSKMGLAKLIGVDYLPRLD